MSNDTIKRITVSLTHEAADAVEVIAERSGISASEVVRRGIALLRFVDDEKAKGGEFLVRGDDGELGRIQFIFGASS